MADGLSQPLVIGITAMRGGQFVQLFLRPPHKQALPADVRMQPVW